MGRLYHVFEGGFSTSVDEDDPVAVKCFNLMVESEKKSIALRTKNINDVKAAGIDICLPNDGHVSYWDDVFKGSTHDQSKYFTVVPEVGMHVAIGNYYAESNQKFKVFKLSEVKSLNVEPDGKEGTIYWFEGTYVDTLIL